MADMAGLGLEGCHYKPAGRAVPAGWPAVGRKISQAAAAGTRAGGSKAGRGPGRQGKATRARPCEPALRGWRLEAAWAGSLAGCWRASQGDLAMVRHKRP